MGFRGESGGGDEVGQGPGRAWGWQMSVSGALGRVMGSCEVRGCGGGEAGARTGHGAQQRRNRVLCGGGTVSGATTLRGLPRGGRWEGAVWGAEAAPLGNFEPRACVGWEARCGEVGEGTGAGSGAGRGVCGAPGGPALAPQGLTRRRFRLMAKASEMSRGQAGAGARQTQWC